jgi:hypothetical protein
MTSLETTRLQPSPIRRAVLLRNGLIVFVLFLTLYATLARLLAGAPVYFTNNNVFFGADHLEPIQDWPRLVGEFRHEGAHPLAILLLHPPAALLAWMLKSDLRGVLGLTTLCGAVSVALCYAACSLWQQDPVRSLAPTLVFGLSMSQLIFSSVPETYAPIGAILALTYWLLVVGLTGGRVGVGAWLAAGVLALGLLLTALIQPLVAFAAVVGVRLRGWRRAWPWFVGYAVLVLSVAALLSLLQQRLFPGTELFFMGRTYAEQAEFVDLARVTAAPLAALRSVASTFLLLDWIGVAPTPVVRGDNPDLFFAYTANELQYGWLGNAAALLWVVLLGDGMVQNVRTRVGRAYLFTLGAIILANAILYSVFNPDEMFLYSTTATLPVLLIGVSRHAALSAWRGLAWWGLAALVGANNLGVLLRFVAWLMHT